MRGCGPSRIADSQQLRAIACTFPYRPLDASALARKSWAYQLYVNDAGGTVLSYKQTRSIVHKRSMENSVWVLRARLGRRKCDTRRSLLHALVSSSACCAMRILDQQ